MTNFPRFQRLLRNSPTSLPPSTTKDHTVIFDHDENRETTGPIASLVNFALYELKGTSVYAGVGDDFVIYGSEEDREAKKTEVPT